MEDHTQHFREYWDKNRFVFGYRGVSHGYTRNGIRRYRL
jgi:hypothetical protein